MAIYELFFVEMVLRNGIHCNGYNGDNGDNGYNGYNGYDYPLH